MFAFLGILLIRLHDLYVLPGLFEQLRLVELGYAPPESIDEYAADHGGERAAQAELICRLVIVVGLTLWWSSMIRAWRDVRPDAPSVAKGVASWLIPFANWFVPFHHLRQMAGDHGFRLPIFLWQAGFICMQLAGATTSVMGITIESADQIRAYWYAGAVESVIIMLAGTAMSWVVIGLGRRNH